MKKLGTTTMLAICAMTTALGVLFIYAASMLPVMRLALLFLASFVIWIPLNEKGGVAPSLVCYAATLLVALLIVPKKLYVVMYAGFFGLYGFVKLGIDAHISDKLVALALKLIIMNALAALIIWLGGLIIKQDIFSLLPEYPLYLMIPAMEAAFVTYEFVYTFCIGFFDSRLRGIIVSRR